MFPLRDENPTHHFPLVTVSFIVLNSLIFAYEWSLGPQAEAFIYQMGILPSEITRFHRLPSLFTSMFLHAGIGHLIGNMWFLWIFGDNLEDFMGHFRFGIYYLMTGIIGGLVHVVLHPYSNIPTIGASGAISGILGGYILLHPLIRVRTLMVLGFYITVLRIPAYFFLGIWFVMQLFGSLGGSSETSIAFGAHIGGFIAGALLVKLPVFRRV